MTQHSTDPAGPHRDPLPAGGITIDSGDCFISLSFDLAFAVDLDRAGPLIAHALPGARLLGPGEESTSFEFHPPPLVYEQSARPVRVGGHASLPSVRCVIHQFGAASFIYRIPLQGDLESLVGLSNDLYDNPELLTDARERADALLAAAGPALSRPERSALSEDYAVYHLRRLTPEVPPDELLARHAGTMARILRSEPRTLSAQEVADAVEGRMSLTPHDLTLVDWNAAIIVQPDTEGRADQAPTAGDIRAVLEFANIALLELRFLDDRLDRNLEGPVDALSRRAWQRRLLHRPMGGELRRLSELQAEAAMLFDAVNNAFKLVGDPYLARLFRLAGRQLHLAEWDGAIRSRLAAAESIYGKITTFQTTRRMEILEWAIVLLIAFEVVMSFVRS